MAEPHYLQPLHAEYAQLAQCDPSTLTGDQRHSLRYYHADRNLGTDPGAFTHAHDRMTSWVRTVRELDAFILTHGRHPRENNRLPKGQITAEERSLAWRLEYQRRATTRARHCEYQRRRLECVPGFTRKHNHDAWAVQYQAYETFLHEHKRAPAYRSTDPVEKSLAGWAAKQRLRYRESGLEIDRIGMLNQLPIWTWGTTRGTDSRI